MRLQFLFYQKMAVLPWSRFLCFASSFFFFFFFDFLEKIKAAYLLWESLVYPNLILNIRWSLSTCKVFTAKMRVFEIKDLFWSSLMFHLVPVLHSQTITDIYFVCSCGIFPLSYEILLAALHNNPAYIKMLSEICQEYFLPCQK